MQAMRIPAAFYRGGTSKAVIFKETDLPKNPLLRDAILLYVLGSPDSYQRQLNGLGGGLSSLSKAVIVEPSDKNGIDVNYTFAQVSVDRPVVDYSAMCGNMSSSVGPFAVEEGMVSVKGDRASIRIYNTNTNKVFTSEFDIVDGIPVEEGEFDIAGVEGSGAKITLNYLEPGGATTNKLLPSGKTVDLLETANYGSIKASLVDSSNPVIFIRSSDLKLPIELQAHEIENTPQLMDQLEQIRRAGAVVMGLASSIDTVQLASPKIALVDEPTSFISLDKQHYPSHCHDIAIRMVSMERVHHAVTLTGAMCLAVACCIPETIPNQIAPSTGPIRIGNPSGILPIKAKVINERGENRVVSATSYRTQRRIIEGSVLVPTSLLEG